MSVISAIEGHCTFDFGFNGSLMPYRNAVVDPTESIGTLPSFQPRESLIGMENGGFRAQFLSASKWTY